MSTLPGRPVTGTLRPQKTRALSSYGVSSKGNNQNQKMPKFLHLDDLGRV